MFICPACQLPIHVSIWRFLPSRTSSDILWAVECPHCKSRSYIPEHARWVGFLATLLSAWLLAVLRDRYTVQGFFYILLLVLISFLIGTLASRLATRELKKVSSRNFRDG